MTNKVYLDDINLNFSEKRKMHCIFFFKGVKRMQMVQYYIWDELFDPKVGDFDKERKGLASF